VLLRNEKLSPHYFLCKLAGGIIFYDSNEDEDKPENSSAPNTTMNIIAITTATKYQIKDAFAQLALLGFVPLPNAQTNSIIRPTKGIAVINIVKNQSPVLTGSQFCPPVN
jgi:hypothetical protein